MIIVILCVLCCNSRAASAIGGIGSCWSLLFKQASPKFILKSLSKFDKFATQCFYLFQKQQTCDPYLPRPHWTYDRKWSRSRAPSSPCPL